MSISLVIFSTTKGNFHQTDIYSHAIDDLFKRVPPDYFAERLAHIKDGGESDAQLMIKGYEARGIVPIVTQGRYKHFDQSHANEYEKDICKMSELVQSDYTLFLECDWIFRTAKENPHTVRYYLDYAIDLLEKNKDFTCVRFPHELYDTEIFKSRPITSSTPRLNGTNYFYSLNPHVLRTKDYRAAVDCINENRGRLSPHIEWKMTQAFNIITANQGLFIAFDPLEIRVRHIGAENWREELSRIEKEYE